MLTRWGRCLAFWGFQGTWVSSLSRLMESTCFCLVASTVTESSHMMLPVYSITFHKGIPQPGRKQLGWLPESCQGLFSSSLWLSLTATCHSKIGTNVRVVKWPGMGRYGLFLLGGAENPIRSPIISGWTWMSYLKDQRDLQMWALGSKQSIMFSSKQAVEYGLSMVTILQKLSY